MSDDHANLAQLVMSRQPSDFIGYSEQSIARFREGFMWACEVLYRIEQAAVSESIINELGMRP